jgi:hypothetical protein
MGDDDGPALFAEIERVTAYVMIGLIIIDSDIVAYAVGFEPKVCLPAIRWTTSTFIWGHDHCKEVT